MTTIHHNPMSSRQLGTLMYIEDAPPAIWLRAANQITLWSLAYRKYVTMHKGTVVLTPLGMSALNAYRSSGPATRKIEDAPTDRVAVLLKLARAKAAKAKPKPTPPAAETPAVA